MIDFAVLRQQFIDAAVTAVNGVGYKVVDRAKDKAPVRKVFSGGRQTVRFKTAEEIEAGREIRARLGLAPEILATPEAIERVRAGRINPKSSRRIKGEEFGFARTVEHPGRLRRDRPGESAPANRPRNLRNRANTFADSQRARLVDPLTVGAALVRLNRVRAERGEEPETTRLISDTAEGRLTARGRYELKTQRALSARLVRVSLDLSTGEVRKKYAKGSLRIGGALRDSIHLEPASANQYPVIKASVVAGGQDAPYAKFQELGTRHNPAHPFLRPALAPAKEELPDALRRSVRRLGR